MATNRKNLKRYTVSDFKPWELVFLSGQGTTGLNKWQMLGLDDLKSGTKAYPPNSGGERTPEQLRAAWREATGTEPYDWKKRRTKPKPKTI